MATGDYSTDWFEGTVEELCARRGFVRSSDFKDFVRITYYSELYIDEGSGYYRPIRLMTNDVSDYFNIGDIVRFQVTRSIYITVTQIHIVRESHFIPELVKGKVMRLNGQVGYVSVHGNPDQFQFRDQCCATPQAQSLEDWFRIGQEVMMKLNPIPTVNKDRIVVSVWPVYEDCGTVTKVYNDKFIAYAKAKEGEIFLPSSKWRRPEGTKFEDVVLPNSQIHFWSKPNHQARKEAQPWIAYLWHMKTECVKYDMNETASCNDTVHCDENVKFQDTEVQTEELESEINESANDFEETFCQLKLPTQFQDTISKSHIQPENIKCEAVDFVKKFTELMFSDGKLYGYMKEKHEKFAGDAILLADKCIKITQK